MAIALISCSERQPQEFEGPKQGEEKLGDERDITVLTQREANAHIQNAVNNMKIPHISDPDWFVIDFQIAYK